MLRRSQEINLQLLQVLDAFLLLFAFWAGYVLRAKGADWFGSEPIPPFDHFRWMIWVIMPAGPLLLEAQGFYQHTLRKTVGQAAAQIARAVLGMALLVILCVAFGRLELPSRAALLLFLALGVGCLIARDRFVLQYIRHRSTRDALREPVLLAGLPEETQGFVAALTDEQRAQLRFVDHIDIERRPISELIEALHRHAVSRVIFVAAQSQLQKVQEAVGACETEGVEAWLVADFIKTAIARPDFDTLGGRPMLVFRTTSDASWALLAKRLLDFFGALVGLLVLSPLLLVVWLAIRLTSPGPVVFRQLRGGKHGRPFTMYKFRTMHTDAEMRRAELAAMNQMSGPVFKVAADPRVTRLGRFLRKTSIDELPQLLNVLRGEMSLVGPRPLPLYEVEKFESPAQRRRLSVPPGLTCLWQISGRNEIKDFSDWVRLDLVYIDNWSFWLDLKILLKTVPVVLLGLGAK
ncbi:MAG: sugar transferase [Verrucomicrobia bacterium]|nr:sugar transferase [Verrucomicrobiota bacterium]